MSTSTGKPRRRWSQFSLRTLLIVVAAAAALAFVWIKTVEPYRRQRETMVVITKLGGSYRTEEAVGWIRYLDKTAQDIVVVDLADCDQPDEYLPHLARLPRLRTLLVGGQSIGDEQVEALGRLGSLKGLVVDSTLVTDERLDEINKMLPDVVVWKSERRAVDELRKLGAQPLVFKASGLPAEKMPPSWLRADVGVKYFADSVLALYLGDTHIPDNGLAFVADLPSLEWLMLANTSVTDDGLVCLQRNTTLKRLCLNGTKITDQGIPHLEKMTQLDMLEIQRTAISREGTARLRRTLPNCTVLR